MPSECDQYNEHVRRILSAVGIMTWDEELLQSLLMPYVIRNPDNGNLNHYHVRLPEDQEYDLAWLWDQVLRGLLRFVHAAGFGDKRAFEWIQPLDIPLVPVGTFYGGVPAIDLASARDWPTPMTSSMPPALRVGDGRGKAKSRDDDPPCPPCWGAVWGAGSARRGSPYVVQATPTASQASVHRDAAAHTQHRHPAVWGWR